jgi:hypothetical protein
MMPNSLLRPVFCIGTVTLFSMAAAETYQVGPGRSYTTLQAVAPLVEPGDVVEVDGNHTYDGPILFDTHGTDTQKITLRGIRVDGHRPRLHGGADVLRLEGNHYLVEGFEVTGSTSPVTTNRGIFIVAHDVTIRDCYVHDCPRHGILGADNYSGDQTIEYTEVSDCGEGTGRHQLYMATDNVMYPNAIVRIRFCHIHDGNGGNNIKSRATRNEIHYNWIEGATYHELELIGADPNGQSAQVDLREDSEVVGNILVKSPSSSGAIARIGGDGTGDSNGRFRFVNNTMIMPAGTAGLSCIRIFDHAQSLEFHNNVVYRGDTTPFRVVRTVEQQGTTAHIGANNWITTTGYDIPSAWTDSLTGTSPGFVNLAGFDFTPAEASPLRNAGALPASSPAAYPFPSPLAAPQWLPPQRTVLAPGAEAPRPENSLIDIGALEHPEGAGLLQSIWLMY